jgi:hypothetical protein
MATAIEAALEANHSAAPNDEHAQAIQGINSRITAVESVLAEITPIAGALIPGAAPVITKISAIESAVGELQSFMASASPLIARLEAYFHSMGGKF